MIKSNSTPRFAAVLWLATIGFCDTLWAAPDTNPLSALNNQYDATDSSSFLDDLPFDVTGYWETRVGGRLHDDPYEKDTSIGESRLQIELEKEFDTFSLGLTTDLLYDPVLDDHDIDLEQGEGYLDLREAYIEFSPMSWIDVKLGRQILTWGTGDLIFINDLFPKAYRYFSGRSAEYLKAPSDAIKLAFFNPIANLDVVYTPRFDADQFIDGSRLSYYNNTLGRIAGRDAIVTTNKPDDWFDDDEVALRLHRNLNGNELALYAYRGFWKSPAGSDPVTGRAIHPRMAEIGFSVRGVVGKGIGNVEYGYYSSLDDPEGDNPLINNSEMRLLVGYEQELAKNLTIGLQYYLTAVQDYDNYKNNLPAGSPVADEHQHQTSIRLTKLAMNQNLTLSLFGFFYTSDRDSYFRPEANYKLNDYWDIEIGANIFSGKEQYTAYGQLKKNSNLYITTRYSF
jgi:hypothetical protein